MSNSGAPPPPPPPPRGGLSLYANLLGSSNPSGNSTISRAPVLFSQNASSDSPQGDSSTAKKQPNAAALRFQPTKRPQLAASKATKPRVPLTTASAPQIEQGSTDISARQNLPSTAPFAKSTIADWTRDDDDVNGFLADSKRQRGGRKKRKKGKEEKAVVQDWDDIYDPSRPNVYEDYKNSEEKYREVREWKDRLYAHRFAKERDTSDASSDSERERERPVMNRGFAPPAAYSFAPPKEETLTNDDSSTNLQTIDEEDPYMRRMRMSQVGNIPPPPPTALAPPPPPPPPTPAEAPLQPHHNPPATLPPTNTISHPPVRYQLPEAPAELTSAEAELALAVQRESEASTEEAVPSEDATAPRSLRPGQKGFAQRLMSKYGWTKGSGLGADGSGIVAPLRVQVEKRAKKADADGGGFVGPAGKGKIIAAKRNEAPREEGKFGPMSEVVVLHGMVDGMDLGVELGDGGLMQEIGEECSDKYGRVERVFIDRDSQESSIPVFVKFTSQLSALRAVNALEGRIFNGNPITARFFDSDRFESGVYK